MKEFFAGFHLVAQRARSGVKRLRDEAETPECRGVVGKCTRACPADRQRALSDAIAFAFAFVEKMIRLISMP